MEVANEIGNYEKLLIYLYKFGKYSILHAWSIVMLWHATAQYVLDWVWTFILFCFVESLYSVKTKYIVADFSGGKEIYDEIEQQLSGIPVGILGKLLNF